jgi:hypothetical protein
MDFDSMSLAQLFAAADAIADHRSAKERYRMQRKLKRAQAALAEAIGSDCEQQ